MLRHLANRGNVWPNVCAVAIDDLFLRLLLDSAATTPQSPVLRQAHAERDMISNPASFSFGATGEPLHHGSHRPDSHAHGSFTPCRDLAHQHLACAKPPVPKFHSNHNQYQPPTTQEHYEQNHSLFDHATNVMGPSPSSFDPQTSIPWLAGPDAAAATSSNIFEQFDIPFWMGDDQYSSLMGFEL